MAADLLLESESATSAARDAARQLAEDSAGKDAALALAAFACADANLRCAKDGIQMHGGIAFTWEHPAHLYLRRARSGVQMFGDSSHWRERYIQALEATQKEAAA
jgi:alkylation response protein AidB-like acyl-CoA dehydrogenase